MISILGVWTYIIILSITYGVPIFKVTTNYLKLPESHEKPGAEIISLLGLIGIMIVLSIISLFQPINYSAHLIIIFIGFILILVFREKYKIFFKLISKGTKEVYFYVYSIIVCVFSFLILIQSVKHPFVTDTGLYHAQTVQWFENYKVIPGLGNLHGRLAFNSHFHLLAAFFSTSFISTQPLYYGLNGYFLWLVLLFFCRLSIKSVTNNSILTVFYLGSLLLIFIYYRDWISSPTPDISVTVVILIIFSLVFQTKEASEIKDFSWHYIITILLSISLITIKLSSILIFISVCYTSWFYRKKLDYKYFAFIASISAIAIAPWIIRNIILSGYLIYPLDSIDLFSFDWKIPIEKVKFEKEWVNTFAKIPLNEEDYKLAYDLSFSEWFPQWFIRQWWIDKIIFIFICISPVVVGFRIFKNKSVANSRVIGVWLTAFLAVIAWFIMAPTFRFGHGFIITCFLLSTIILVDFQFRKIYIYLLSIALIGYGLNSIRVELLEFKSMASVIIYPEKYLPAPSEKYRFNNTVVGIPINDKLCWDAPLPCTPYFNPNLMLRGNSLDKGFKIIKSN